jgi:hypothetical protein
MFSAFLCKLFYEIRKLFYIVIRNICFYIWHIKGLIKNLGNEIVSGGYFFEIVSSEYLPEPDVNFTLIPVYGGEVVSLQDNKLFISTIAQLQEISFDLTYITEN